MCTYVYECRTSFLKYLEQRFSGWTVSSGGTCRCVQMTSTLSHWYFDWILWLQWFQWRHSLFKLRPIEKRIAFVFCHRRNKLGIFAVPACTCPRCFTVVPHCLWCSPFLYSWPAPTVYFTRIFIVMVRSHPAIHTRFCRWYNHIPLNSPFCEAM